MALVISVFSNSIISALCDMIVHSLWQGGLLAACVGLILVLTRNKPSSYRYNLLITVLTLFSVTALYTFINGIVHLTAHGTINTPDPGKTTSLIIGEQAVQLVQIPFTDKVIMYLNANSVFIVCIWFVIVCLKSMQLAMGVRSAFLLRYKETTPANVHWQLRIKELSQKMGITTAIHIVESGIAKVPMVVGHLKPFILIPLGMLASLPQAEVEAILVHELAHIRRKDYLVNMLQSLLEIVFFFNPAVLWTSSLIKKEREHCCDDISIATASNKVAYIKALVACQEYVYQQPRYAMALNGEKKHLLSRVKRLVTKDRQPITYLEKSILATCILAIALLITFFSYGERKKNITTTITHTTSTISHNSESNPIANPNNIAIKIYKPTDVGNGTSIKYVGDGQSAYLLKENGILYQLFVKEERADDLYVNGEKISEGNLPDYNSMIGKLMMLYHGESEAAEANEATPVFEAYEENDNADVNPLVLPVQACIASPVNPIIAADEETPVTVNVKSVNLIKPVNPVKLVNPIKPVNPVAPKQDAYQSQVLISDMIRDHIIAEENSTLSFKLTSKEFVVNGIKQPETIYSKYKSKYIQPIDNREVTWYYNYDTSSEPQKQL
jgi:beta-lactamase regulating signal transducer with metallopeptidase domain